MGKNYAQSADSRHRRRKGVLALAVAAVFLIAVVAAFTALDRGTASVSGTEENVRETQVGGISCVPKTRVKTYLFMGIDEDGKVTKKTEYTGRGQCDVLRVLVIDQNADTYAVLPINRDTMTNVHSLDMDGTDLGATWMQIALAHSDGDGLEMSCENTVRAVSELLYGQTIDGYIALNMDSIGVLNHLAGGVTVTIEDDFSAVDSTLVQGTTVTLTDEQAVTYARNRMEVGDGTNESRMRRQETFLEGLETNLREKISEDENYVQTVYDSLQDYMVTDMSGKDCSKLAKAVMSDEFLGKYTLEGTDSISEETGFAEFTLDEECLAETVVKLFYEQTEE